MKTMEIQLLRPGDTEDFIRLTEIFRKVFESSSPLPDPEYLAGLLSSEEFKVFVVRIHGQVTGGLTMHVLKSYYRTKPTGYIYDVGIAPPFQGKGLGKALLAEVGRFCEENGFGEMYVEAEKEDSDAVEFYHKTRPHHVLEAVHFTWSFGDPPGENDE